MQEQLATCSMLFDSIVAQLPFYGPALARIKVIVNCKLMLTLIVLQTLRHLVDRIFSQTLSDSKSVNLYWYYMSFKTERWYA